QLADRPQHLELELRDAIAIVTKCEALDHDIGGAAIGRRVVRTLLRRNQWVDRLLLAAAIDAQPDPFAVDLASVGPDAPDAGDLALAEREGDIGEVVIFGDLWPGLAALPARGAPFLEARRPDHYAAEARRAVEPRDRSALLGSKGPCPRQPRSFD